MRNAPKFKPDSGLTDATQGRTLNLFLIASGFRVSLSTFSLQPSAFLKGAT